MSLRLVKVPDAAPPYDCEIHGAGCPAMRAAAASRRDLTREPGSGARSWVLVAVAHRAGHPLPQASQS